MELTWKKDYLDFVLVPSGLLIMLGYHLLHLHRCLKVPHKTVIGYENYHRRAWVERVLQVEFKERGLAVAVISGNLSAATSLASVSLALSSIIGAWIGSYYHNDQITRSIYGNTSSTIMYLKYISLLSCFIIAFACFVQTARCLVHANFLLSMPNSEIAVSNVESAVIKGSNFWVIGLRSLYFATNLLLWIFGPIPMFICSVAMVVLLHYLDKNATPLTDYNKPVSYETYKKIDKEMTAVSVTTESNGRLQDCQTENGTSSARY